MPPFSGWVETALRDAIKRGNDTLHTQLHPASTNQSPGAFGVDSILWDPFCLPRPELAAQFAGVFGSEKQGAAFHTEIQVGLLGTSGEITPSAAASSSGVDVSLRRIVREFLS